LAEVLGVVAAEGVVAVVVVEMVLQVAIKVVL
jgi:hypothetical protein